jgi:hypothetical protein
MIPADRGDGDLAAIAGALLDQGGRADGLSRLITTAALIALMVWPALPGRPPVLMQVVLGVVALAGLGESYLASRVGFDVALFRRLADRRDTFDLDRLDSVLLRSNLIAPAKTGRSIAARVSGARRLLQWQGRLLGLQVALILGGSGFFAWRGQDGG